MCHPVRTLSLSLSRSSKPQICPRIAKKSFFKIPFWFTRAEASIDQWLIGRPGKMADGACARVCVCMSENLPQLTGQCGTTVQNLANLCKKSWFFLYCLLSTLKSQLAGYEWIANKQLKIYTENFFLRTQNLRENLVSWHPFWLCFGTSFPSRLFNKSKESYSKKSRKERCAINKNDSLAWSMDVPSC